MCFFYQMIKIFKGTKEGMNSSMVCDVVTKVDHRRGLDRGDPQRVNA